MLILMNIMMSMSMVFMKHPLSISSILFSQTILIAMITGYLNMNYWFSYMLFLIMIGGMLILFMYMTSIASNEMFYLNKIKSILVMLLLIFLVLAKIISNFNFIEMNLFKNLKFNHMFFIIKFFNFPMSMIMLLMIIYLFITLIATVKIIKIKQGPMRQLT